jgi:hypothetical protein
MFRLSFVPAFVAIITLTSATFASDFTFDVPGLVGHYDAMHSVRDVQLDLGMPFDNIDEVSLRLVGYHQPGVLLPLGAGPGQPYPMEMMGAIEDTAPAVTGFDQNLPLTGSSFDLTFDFKNLYSHSSPANFLPLLDGQADFSLRGAGGPFVAIYMLGQFPEAHINSATLNVSGQPQSFNLSGDVNLDGLIDMADYVMWRHINGSAAEYGQWRAHFGDNIPASGASFAQTAMAPEPSSLVLCVITALNILATSRSKAPFPNCA